MTVDDRRLVHLDDPQRRQPDFDDVLFWTDGTFKRRRRAPIAAASIDLVTCCAAGDERMTGLRAKRSADGRGTPEDTWTPNPRTLGRTYQLFVSTPLPGPPPGTQSTSCIFCSRKAADESTLLTSFQPDEPDSAPSPSQSDQK